MALHDPRHEQRQRAARDARETAVAICDAAQQAREGARAARECAAAQRASARDERANTVRLRESADGAVDRLRRSTHCLDLNLRDLAKRLAETGKIPLP